MDSWASERASGGDGRKREYGPAALAAAAAVADVRTLPGGHGRQTATSRTVDGDRQSETTSRKWLHIFEELHTR